MRQYLARTRRSLEVVELPEAHTTSYISRSGSPARSGPKNALDILRVR